MVLPYLQDRGIGEETAAAWGLGCVLDPIPGHERFRRSLSIPYITPAGVVGFKFRCMQDHDHKENGHAKYNSESGQPTRVFGSMSFQRPEPYIVVTEGELDAITFHEAGLPAVGIPGAENWKRHMAYCFEGYEEVIVIAEGDPAGKDFASRVSAAIYNARIVEFDEGEDPNSFLVKHGPQALRTKVGISDDS